MGGGGEWGGGGGLNSVSACLSLLADSACAVQRDAWLRYSLLLLKGGPGFLGLGIKAVLRSQSRCNDIGNSLCCLVLF